MRPEELRVLQHSGRVARRVGSAERRNERIERGQEVGAAGTCRWQQVGAAQLSQKSVNMSKMSAQSEQNLGNSHQRQLCLGPAHRVGVPHRDRAKVPAPGM